MSDLLHCRFARDIIVARIQGTALVCLQAFMQLQYVFVDSDNIMAATIKVAFTPMQERFDTTITPMHRVINNLHAEFVFCERKQTMS